MLPMAERKAKYRLPSSPMRARVMHIEQAAPARLETLTFSLASKLAPLLVERARNNQVACGTSGGGSAITCQKATTLPNPSAVIVTPSTPDIEEILLHGSK